MEPLVHFLKRYVGRFGTFNLFLLALENMMGDNFVCPCKLIYNHVSCFMYAFVPALGCLIFTMWFLDLSPENETGEEGDVNRATSKRDRVFYSFCAVLIWLSLFFADGRYVACAYSDWEGLFKKSEDLGIGKWCEPTGNKTSKSESQLRTLDLISKSQLSGFSVMTFVIIIITVFKCCCQKSQSITEDHSARNTNGGGTVNQ